MKMLRVDSMIIAQVCLRLATIKGHSKMCSFTVLGGSGGSEKYIYIIFTGYLIFGIFLF